jgi:hypothetical protein
MPTCMRRAAQHEPQAEKREKKKSHKARKKSDEEKEQFVQERLSDMEKAFVELKIKIPKNANPTQGSGVNERYECLHTLGCLDIAISQEWNQLSCAECDLYRRGKMHLKYSSILSIGFAALFLCSSCGEDLPYFDCSTFCQWDGSCHLTDVKHDLALPDDGRCVALEDSDCTYSDVCKEYGRCIIRGFSDGSPGGFCENGDNASCAASSRCYSNNYCTWMYTERRVYECGRGDTANCHSKCWSSSEYCDRTYAYADQNGLGTCRDKQ